ncbi:MAG: YqgE/AlgH family protein [Gammaproteobacteria bacterium]
MLISHRALRQYTFLLVALCLALPVVAAIPDHVGRLPLLKAAPGRFLVASPAMRFNYFRESIILLTQHDRRGSMGVIINRPTILSLAGLLPEYTLQRGYLPLHEGGPVQPLQLSLLVKNPRAQPPSAGDGGLAFVSGTRAVLNLLPAISTIADFRLYSGYCGWTPGQLQSEIRRGAWRVMEGDPALVFEAYPDLLWQRMWRRAWGERE